MNNGELDLLIKNCIAEKKPCDAKINEIKMNIIIRCKKTPPHILCFQKLKKFNIVPFVYM